MPLITNSCPQTKLFINNEFVNAKSGKTFPTINPATGEKICDIAEADKVSSPFIPVPLIVDSRASKFKFL